MHPAATGAGTGTNTGAGSRGSLQNCHYAILYMTLLLRKQSMACICLDAMVAVREDSGRSM